MPRDLKGHAEVARRYFLGLGAAGAAAWSASPLAAGDPWTDARLAKAIARLEYLTPLDRVKPGGRSKLPAVPRQINPATGQPLVWPIRDTIVHWAALLPALAPGNYSLCCRTIDANGVAQPMPRPLPRTGASAIQQVALLVEV